jgi:hypothetical protein
LLTGMTGISLHMQWPLTSQSHGRMEISSCFIPKSAVNFHTLVNFLHGYDKDKLTLV